MAPTWAGPGLLNIEINVTKNNFLIGVATTNEWVCGLLSRLPIPKTRLYISIFRMA